MAAFVPPPPTLTITEAACQLLNALKASVAKYKYFVEPVLCSAYLHALGLPVFQKRMDTSAALNAAKNMVAPGGVILPPPALKKVIFDAVNELVAYLLAVPPGAPC
jgi:hypothetical protein